MLKHFDHLVNLINYPNAIDESTNSYALSGLNLAKSNPSRLKHDISVHASEIKCQSCRTSDTTGSTFPNLQLRTPIQNRSLAGKTFCNAGAWTYPLTASESHLHTEKDKIGVLILNLGGPDILNDVQPFLYNLFADPRPLAQFISTLRIPKSKEGYASIGGGSPLLKITEEQADALRLVLEAKNVPSNVYVAMRF